MYGLSRALAIFAPIGILAVLGLNLLDASRPLALAITTGIVVVGGFVAVRLEERHGGLQPRR
jgi:hypothetical protein